MVNTMSNSIVVKFTIVMGNSYGAGKDAGFIFFWETIAFCTQICSKFILIEGANAFFVSEILQMLFLDW